MLCLLSALAALRAFQSRRWSDIGVAIGSLATTTVIQFYSGNIKIAAYLGAAFCLLALAKMRSPFYHIVAIAVLAAAIAGVVGWFNLAKQGRPISELKLSLAHKFVYRQSDTGYCLSQVLAEQPTVDAAQSPMVLFHGLVPRPLWPSKPTLSVGLDQAVQFCRYPAELVTPSRHSASVTLLGDPLIMAGWPGLVVAQGLLLGGLGVLGLSAARLGTTGLAGLLALTPWLVDFDQHFPLYLALVVKHGITLLPFLVVLPARR